MGLVKAPFRVKWGDNEVSDISELEVEYERDSEDYPTIDGRTYTIKGSRKVTATIKLLRSDIPALAALLPQYHVPNGGIMSTGETVNNANGAIDLSEAACDVEEIHNHLDITSCGSPAQVLRLVNATTDIDSIELDDKIQQISISFTGEPEAGEGVVQMFIEGTINVVS